MALPGGAEIAPRCPQVLVPPERRCVGGDPTIGMPLLIAARGWFEGRPGVVSLRRNGVYRAR